MFTDQELRLIQNLCYAVSKVTYLQGENPDIFLEHLDNIQEKINAHWRAEGISNPDEYGTVKGTGILNQN